MSESIIDLIADIDDRLSNEIFMLAEEALDSLGKAK